MHVSLRFIVVLNHPELEFKIRWFVTISLQKTARQDMALKIPKPSTGISEYLIPRGI